MPEWFLRGGIAMWPLLVCSIAGLAIILERVWALQRSRIISTELSAAIERRPITPEQTEAVRVLSENDPSVLGTLVQAMFAHATLPKTENVEVMQSLARQIVGRMERGLTTLQLIAELGPLLGLLGTVVGMVQLFEDVARKGLGEPAMISRGIYEALTATMTGLGIAIPALVAYMYLRRRIEVLVLELEKHTNEVLTRLYRG
ncbi:MAG TPA: MotA/TolQ/ExbB proton channel family protein [Verrucomicrobiae bacterium]|nr:MotA/TolQ/ExbB proton channel family protein [Verrucomicrobiae bacterium]